MRHAPQRLLCLALAATACIAPPEAEGSLDGAQADAQAPSELNALTRFLFKHHTAGDDALVGAGLANLETWIVTFADGGNGLTASTGLDGRSWQVDDLTLDDVADLPARPNRPIENVISSSVARLSDAPIACHAYVQTLRDQLPVEPTAKIYERTFPDEPNPACFVDASCPRLSSVNDATRANALFESRFILYKDFRWVEYALVDGTPRRGFVSRSWFQESSDGTDGPEGNQLWQSYAVDVWIEQTPDTLLRYQVLWQESDVYVLGIEVADNEQLGTTKVSVDGIFSTTDTYIRDELQPAGKCPG